MNTSQSVATVVSMGVAGVAADAVGARLVFVVAGIICAVGASLAWVSLAALSSPVSRLV